MSDDAVATLPDAIWSSGLNRSYSEHADLVLKHFDSYRTKYHRGEGPKCTRSGPEFRHNLDIFQSEADDEDEDEEDADRCKSNGHRTWRILSSSASADCRHHPIRSKMSDIGCRGDSNDISTELSEMSLTDNNYEVTDTGSGPDQNHKIITSSVDLPRRKIYQDYGGDNEDKYLLIENYSENDLFMSDEMKFIERLEQGDYTSQETGGVEMVGITESTSSLSTLDANRRRLDGKPLSREISYENWAKDKQRELQRRKMEERMAEEKRREQKELELRAREEKERREYQSYLDWVERKKREKMLKKKLVEKELSLKQRIREVEDKAKLAKNICLKQWYKKKEQQQKALEKEEILKRQRSEEEKQRRLQESSKAYEKWREKAKNTPRPATQGLLPHQTAKPTFTNPKPWQPLVNNPSDESDSEMQSKPSSSTLKNSVSRRSVVQR